MTGSGPSLFLLDLFFPVSLSAITRILTMGIVISLSQITTFHELNPVLLWLSQVTNGMKVHQALMGKAQH